MKVLVTGGAGFIGSHYVRCMLDGGYPGYERARVTVLDKLTYAGNTDNLPIGHERLTFVRGDICDPDVLAEVLPGHDAVVHFAAESHVDRSVTGAAPFVTTNVLDTLRPPPASVRRVTITFSRGAQRVTVPATRLNTGRWQVAGTQLSASGNWRIAVAVERKGMPVATYATGWTVSSLPLPPGTHRPRHSQRPLGPILSALAIVLAALFLLAGLWLSLARVGIRRARTA